jgi:hypothetical protein
MKLYHVSMTLDIDMVVLAENKEEAVQVGKDNWSDEILDSGIEPEHVAAFEVTRRKQLEFARALAPLDGIQPKGAHNPQLSIEEYLDELGIKD